MGEAPEDVFARLERKEFGCVLAGPPVQVATIRPTREDLGQERGHVISEVWLGRLADRGRGSWYPHDRLPVPIVYSHRDRVIPVAREAFIARQSSGSPSLPAV